MSKNQPSGKKNTRTVYGFHPVQEAIKAGMPVDKILIRQGFTHAGIFRKLAKESGIPLQMVPEVRLEKFAPNANHQGVIGILSAITYQPLEELILAVIEKGEIPFFMALDGVTDVRNFGAIARTAECMGAHALIIPSHGSAAVNADAVKTSAGALHHLPVCREANLVDSLMLMQAYDIKSVACTEKASETIHQVDLKTPSCLIMGSEEKGISPAILKRADHLVRIPMYGKVGSLNVSVAAGMIMAEAVRQRTT